MTKLMQRLILSLKKTFSNGKPKRRFNNSKKIQKRKQRGGSVYSFDLNDKVGGLPARVSLNGTIDGDCPTGKLLDPGLSNYNLATGGNRKKK